MPSLEDDLAPVPAQAQAVENDVRRREAQPGAQRRRREPRQRRDQHRGETEPRRQGDQEPTQANKRPG